MRFSRDSSCFTLAESLGGVESLIAHPASMTHAGMEESARARAGIGPGLLRVSVGIEDAADLVADLEAGLERAAAAATPATRVATRSLKCRQHRIAGGTRRSRPGGGGAMSAGSTPASIARETAASSARASASSRSE